MCRTSKHKLKTFSATLKVIMQKVYKYLGEDKNTNVGMNVFGYMKKLDYS